MSNLYPLQNVSSYKSLGSKYSTMLTLVESLLDAGVPLDGIGFQAHLIVGSVPNFQAQIEAFTNLGLEVSLRL